MSYFTHTPCKPRFLVFPKTLQGVTSSFFLLHEKNISQWNCVMTKKMMLEKHHYPERHKELPQATAYNPTQY